MNDYELVREHAKYMFRCEDLEKENAALREEVERLKENLRLSEMGRDMALAASEEMTKENAALAEITAYLEPITKTPAEYCPWGIDVARVVMGMVRKAATP